MEPQVLLPPTIATTTVMPTLPRLRLPEQLRAETSVVSQPLNHIPPTASMIAAVTVLDRNEELAIPPAQLKLDTGLKESRLALHSNSFLR
jgi:hypothetical protein